MPASTLTTLVRPGGTVAVEIAGEGPLVVCVPGMGDLRASYRLLAPALVSAGFRVAVMDLRGHGDSSATFTEYGDIPTAGDVVALLDQLGGTAVVIGSSMGAGAAVLAAAERPQAVRGLVLIGPFVRDGQVPMLKRLAWRAAMAPPWATLVWRAMLPSLYAGTRPADLDDYRAQVAASLRRPAHARAFRLTTRTSHAQAQAALPRAAGLPTLVIMGADDPDFPDPAAEATWVAEQLGGSALVVQDAGHYPHSQRPDQVGGPVVALARQVHADA